MQRAPEILQADITRLRVDAIVNAANPSLLGGGGVDGAIHRAAGPQLLAYCARLGGCPTGQARITPGYALPARHVIHTVGPVWQDGRTGEPDLLAACYRSVFALVREHAIRSVAFPAISCGVYGYPWDEAARIAVRECRLALAELDQLERVTLVAFNAAMLAVLESACAAPGGNTAPP
ncbi:MAG: O-acetyl-ADP-ribose deacetylase [Sterolibacteriaceae bacterium]|nr:O-acetyl-ADP-ribose deacetylase [Candidatus Methylophosphatis haderslevensis]